jgi:superfamily II DNA or RNA helicase
MRILTTDGSSIMNIFDSCTIQPYSSDILLSQNQQKFLVDQVIDQLRLFYSGQDNRKMVLNAFTGSGKTTVTIKSLIPEFIKNFSSDSKRIIGFTAPRKEVVQGAYRNAKRTLNGKSVAGKTIRVYDDKKITNIKKGVDTHLDGDIILLFITAQFFSKNYDLLTANKSFDLMVVDEAHIMFGTISAEDTKADKGTTIKDFDPVTLNKLSEVNGCAVLFLTATPTNSQQENTPLGTANNVYLSPMPRDVLTTPFFDIKAYLEVEDTLLSGLKHFKSICDKNTAIVNSIDTKSWQLAKTHFIPTHPAIMVRVGRRGAKNGVDFEQYLDEIRTLCKSYGFILFISTSEFKEYDGKKIDSLDEGVNLANNDHSKPIVMLVIDSGYAGVDFVRINNVIIGREPKTTIHNNYSQTAGRAARLKFGFTNHAQAVDFIRGLNVSDTIKRQFAEYYILHSTSTIHVPVDSKLLNNDVKEFIESDTFREVEGRKYVLESLFGDDIPGGLYLTTSTTLKNDAYKQYKKEHCECCDTKYDGNTSCFHDTWSALSSTLDVNISLGEMKIIWSKCLQVHHKDSNHYNNVPENLMTICPNIHSAITIKNEDYKNRYDDLREEVAKLVKKKKVDFSA